MAEYSSIALQYRNPFKTGDENTRFSRPFHLFFFFWVIVYLAAIGQDYVGASVNNSAFYLSESILFNTSWLVFIPISFVIIFAVRKPLFTTVTNSFKWLIGIVFSLTLATIHLVGFSLFINIVSGTTAFHTFDFVWMLNETFTEDFYLVFSLYGMLLFFIWIIFKPQKEEIKTNYIDTLTIRKGKSLVPVNVSQIRWIDTESPYIAIHTAKDTYLHSSSLTKVIKKLNPNKFARVHRSAIINVEKVVELTSRLNGDYDIRLEGGAVVRMSRSYSQDVKKMLT